MEISARHRICGFSSLNREFAEESTVGPRCGHTAGFCVHPRTPVAAIAVKGRHTLRSESWRGQPDSTRTRKLGCRSVRPSILRPSCHPYGVPDRSGRRGEGHLPVVGHGRGVAVAVRKPIAWRLPVLQFLSQPFKSGSLMEHTRSRSHSMLPSFPALAQAPLKRHPNIY